MHLQFSSFPVLDDCKQSRVKLDFDGNFQQHDEVGIGLENYLWVEQKVKYGQNAEACFAQPFSFFFQSLSWKVDRRRLTSAVCQKAILLFQSSRPQSRHTPYSTLRLSSGGNCFGSKGVNASF